MKEEDLVDNWCFELDLENEGWLNNGDNGNAYLISDNKVIKITRDHNEFISTHQILKKDNPHLPKIYDMRIFPNGELGILMEELITDGIEDLYNTIQQEADRQEVFDIMDIDIEESQLEGEELKFISDIIHSMEVFKLEGVAHFDIQPNNIGINSEGNYLLFDQTNKNKNEYNEDIILDIEDKLKNNFIIKEEEIKERRIPINKILIEENKIKTLSKKYMIYITIIKNKNF